MVTYPEMLNATDYLAFLTYFSEAETNRGGGGGSLHTTNKFDPLSCYQDMDK